MEQRSLAFEKGRKIFYAGKYRNFAIKNNPENKSNSTSNSDQNRKKKSLNEERFDCEEKRDSTESRMHMLMMFRKIYDTKPPLRADMLAMKDMTRKYRCFEPTKIPGSIPAVEIGDEFYLRVELRIMGLHFQLIHGIDFTDTYPKGVLLATSVVATEGNGDELWDNNVVLYKGEGGDFQDQVMAKGNLALKNSMEKKKDVRVIRGIKSKSRKKTVFVYDGLYKVVNYKEMYGRYGYKEYEFKLVRCPDQEPINWSCYK